MLPLLASSMNFDALAKANDNDTGMTSATGVNRQRQSGIHVLHGTCESPVSEADRLHRATDGNQGQGIFWPADWLYPGKMFARLRIPRVGATIAAAASAPARTTMQMQQRSLHHVPGLAHDFKNGVPGLLSADGYDMAWKQYMTLILDKLNALIAASDSRWTPWTPHGSTSDCPCPPQANRPPPTSSGTDFEQRDIKQILLATAQDPSQAPIFNHASMAHNTHFFFKNITPTPKPMPESLAAELSHSFSSVETLRREMILTAAAMFGPGFVWLVKAGHQDYRILTTYLAGSPYPGAHWRLQSTDMNTVGVGGSANHYFQRNAAAQRPVQTPPGALDAVPLLCLNTWEHTWLRDYGLGVGGVGGKKAFAEAWWEVIDWDAVKTAADIPTRPNFMR
ncbi:putative superoxide dismutase [Colletotrichum sublineola]|uniref:Putative superoxide dismutase n=1 Tax=Colletotrichum sublineola TaxID=1173701 RepID=A0A066WYL1_COLSU|nr:putative superoxide dismutase [Colletotrichum sublineola]